MGLRGVGVSLQTLQEMEQRQDSGEKYAFTSFCGAISRLLLGQTLT